MNRAENRPQTLAPPPDLSAAAKPALFLDFDGTLVDLAETPGGISVPEALPKMLERMCERLGGAVALVSGRSLDDLQTHVGPCAVARAGSHGNEIARADGTPLVIAANVELDAARGEARDFVAGRPGLSIEDKPLGVAIHYRAAPERESEVLAAARNIAAAHGLALKRGKMVAELAAGEAHKGDALRSFMKNGPFEGRTPIFVGDDITDEDGFAAAEELGGFGVLVGQPRPTRATRYLPDVGAVHRWLEGLFA